MACARCLRRWARPKTGLGLSGSSGAPGWQCVLKLINHLDTALLGGGPSGGGKVHMPSEHKGGVKFSYWTPNPWHAQPDDRGLIQHQPAVGDDAWHDAFTTGG